MQGFKSFPDKTVFNFGKGVTAIVGPNGSGKSNVSDAIRWVLGEISSKSLRGNKMEDVIFSGAQGRSPSSFAEVTLCMDNSDGGLNDEHEEVTVTRHYSRSGNSEYYINKKEVRLRDIYELFLDTGIGRDGYSIIGQGQVAEILSPKSDTRREMIDEAAGISKFKHKKHDAEKNLAQTADNLVRLNDILGEVTSRVEPARKESEKTQKYLVLFEEQRKLEVSLWLDEIDSLAGEKEKIQNAYDSAKKNLDICNTEIEECEKGVEQLTLLSQQNSEKIEESREGIKNHEHHMSELSERKSVLENDISHYKERLAELEKEFGELDAKIKEATEKFDGEYSKGKELDEKKAKLEADIAVAQSRTEELSSKLFNIDFEIGNLGLSKELAAQDIAELNTKRSVTKANIAQLESRIAELSQSKKQDTQDAESKEKFEKAEKEKAERAKSLAQICTKLDEIDIKIKNDEQILNSAYVKMQGLMVSKAEKSKHIDMLSRMENMLEGYAFSVKAVMQSANSGKLSGIHGPVSKLISAPEEYAVALEVALGAQAQHIVTENERAAKAGIAELKAAKAGRATFLPLDTVNGRSISSADITNKNGYIGIASELVTFDKKYERIVSYLLGRTVIAKDIDCAASIARSCGFRYKVVSLDGQVVNAGGSFTGGSLSAKTGMLTRSADIEKLTAELSVILKDIDKLQAEIDSANDEKASLYAQSTKLSDEEILLKTSLAAIDAELAAISENMKDYAELRKDRESDIAKLESEIKLMNEELAKLDADADKLEEKQKSDDEISASRKEEQQNMQNENESLKNRLYDMKIELAEVTKDIENYQYSITAMAQTLELDTDSAKGYQKQISELKSKIESVNAEIKETADEIACGDKTYSNMQETVKELDAQNLEYEKKINEFTAKQKKCYGERENLIREFTRSEAKLESGQTEHDRLISRLFDTYDLTYSTAGEFRIVIENKTESGKRLSVLKGEIKKLGSVNLNAVAEYAELKERFDFLTAQVGDLVKSKEELEGIIENLDDEMKRILTEAMKSINENFSRIFKELFGGGKAEITFADEEDIIEGDIEIFAQPPGKTVNNIQLLSGGERSLISISLYYAMIAVSPTPFCIMDEIESALDDVNVDRFAQYAKRFCEKTQFIMITHRRGTMNVADILYGITMQEKGISKYLTISVDEVEQQLGIKL